MVPEKPKKQHYPGETFIRWGAYSAGFFLLLVVAIILFDIILRRLGTSFTGAYDLVKVFVFLALTLSLPFTAAVKGNIAIRVIVHRLPEKTRVPLEIITHFLTVILFAFLTVESGLYGYQKLKSNVVTPTLEIPVFWMAWVLALLSALTAAVLVKNIFHLKKL